MAKQLTNSGSMPSHQEIAERAHDIYELNGRVPGRDLDNWLQAEAELCGKQQDPVSAEAPAPVIAKASSRPGSKGTGRTAQRRQ